MFLIASDKNRKSLPLIMRENEVRAQPTREDLSD